MGIAAYNRGSRRISEDLAREAGTWRDPPRPQPRPEGWGDKAMAQAVERARRILLSNRRYGREIDVETLTACVVDRARVGQDTARLAAEAALANPEGSSTAAPAPRRRGSSRPRIASAPAVKSPVREMAPAGPALDLTPVPPGPLDPKGGFRIDGSVVRFWARKPQALAEAKRLGFKAGAVVRVHTRFQIGYSIQGANGGLLSKALHEAMSPP